MLPDHPAATGTVSLPADVFSASRPLTATEIECRWPRLTTLVTSKTEGVNAVVFVPTTEPSTDSVA